MDLMESFPLRWNFVAPIAFYVTGRPQQNPKKIYAGFFTIWAGSPSYRILGWFLGFLAWDFMFWNATKASIMIGIH